MCTFCISTTFQASEALKLLHQSCKWWTWSTNWWTTAWDIRRRAFYSALHEGGRHLEDHVSDIWKEVQHRDQRITSGRSQWTAIGKVKITSKSKSGERACHCHGLQRHMYIRVNDMHTCQWCAFVTTCSALSSFMYYVFFLQYKQVSELDLPVKHTQLVVMRYISVIREDGRYWCRDLLAETRSKRRWQILTSKVSAHSWLGIIWTWRLPWMAICI